MLVVVIVVRRRISGNFDTIFFFFLAEFIVDCVCVEYRNTVLEVFIYPCFLTLEKNFVGNYSYKECLHRAGMSFASGRTSSFLKILMKHNIFLTYLFWQSKKREMHLASSL